MSETKRYQANPDVSCRPEGPDEGAILFNPDTDAVIVIISNLETIEAVSRHEVGLPVFGKDHPLPLL